MTDAVCYGAQHVGSKVVGYYWLQHHHVSLNSHCDGHDGLRQRGHSASIPGCGSHPFADGDFWHHLVQYFCPSTVDYSDYGSCS